MSETPAAEDRPDQGGADGDADDQEPSVGDPNRPTVDVEGDDPEKEGTERFDAG
jgi:hypothetical protein